MRREERRRRKKKRKKKSEWKMQSLSRWHVYAFTSNRNATICNIAIEKIVSYTQLLLLFNEIDHIAMVYVRSTLFCSHRINLLFFLSLSTQTEWKKRMGGEYMCACGRLIIMTIWLFVTCFTAQQTSCVRAYIKKRKDHDVITNCLCTWPDVVHRHMLDYNSRRYLFLTVSFFFLAFFCSQSEIEYT